MARNWKVLQRPYCFDDGFLAITELAREAVASGAAPRARVALIVVEMVFQRMADAS